MQHTIANKMTKLFLFISSSLFLRVCFKPLSGDMSPFIYVLRVYPAHRNLFLRLWFSGCFFRKPIFRKLLKLRFDGQRSLYLFFLPPYLSEFRFWERRIAKNFLFAVLFVAGLLSQKTVFLHFNITNNRCQYPFLIFLQFFFSKNRQLAVATRQNNGQCAVFIVVSAAVF